MLSAQIFRELPLEEQLAKTQTDYSNWEIWTEENLRTTNEDLSNKMKVEKLKELQKKLKNYDFAYFYSDDGRAYRKGKAQEDEIKKLKDEIGDEGHKVWIKFLKDKGMMEGANGIGIYDYERYYISKLKKWGIKDTAELCPEDKKKFDTEVDKDWNGGNKVKTNMPEQKGLFPEQNSVEGRGTLDYAIRQVGEKSLTASTFGDSGNLYPEHLVQKFIPPSKERLRHMK
jgi:hypothetical protein